MLIGRYGFQLVNFDGVVYAIGGHFNSALNASLPIVEKYDDDSKTWSADRVVQPKHGRSDFVAFVY